MSTALDTVVAAPKAKPIKHKTLSPQYVKSCRLGNETIHKPLTKGGKRELAVSTRDPELELIVKLCARHPAGTEKAGKSIAGRPLPARCPKGCKRDCAHAQQREWLRLRDNYAAKNYSLVFRAAERQWRTNQHLPGEVVPCLYCPGRPTCKHPLKDGRCLICLTGCNRCLNTGQYLCQPDLEALAYSGLLEAIRLCDFSKGGDRISTYAVWLMKQAMMPLLRQTPIFFPQDLLRDRRMLAQLRKSLPCKKCLGNKKTAKACKPCEGTGHRAYTTAEADAELANVRKCRPAETLEERRLLAEGCYYGQEKFSVEELQESMGDKPDPSRSNSAGLRFKVMAQEALSVQPHTVADADDGALGAAIAGLPAAERKLALLWLKGKLEGIPRRVVELLRAEML